MKKCCFISIYFGDIPVFFKPFLQSCGWNKSFNWLIIHDKRIPYELPSNVDEFTMDIIEFEQLIADKIGVTVHDIKPYKVCDFRPAFGLLFKEYLADFKFWGICDTDLLLGDLETFITDDILNKYDKVFTMGHLSIVKNSEFCNNLFYLSTPNSRDYKSIFMAPENCIFDEVLGFTEKFIDKGLHVYKKKVCADVWCDCKRIRVCERWLIRLIQPNNKFLLYSTDKNYTHQIFILNKGKIFKVYFDKRKLKFQEYSYIHKIEHGYEGELNATVQLIISTQKYIENDTIFEHIEEKTITKKEMEAFGKRQIFSELKHDVYLYLFWNYQYIKKTILQRVITRD